MPLEFRWDRAGGQLVIVLLMEAFVFRPSRPKLCVFNNPCWNGSEAGAPVNNCNFVHLLTDRQTDGRNFPFPSGGLLLIYVIYGRSA